jgi:hypothetical protein
MRFAAVLAFALAALAPAGARASCIATTAQQTVAAVGAVPSGALVVAAPLESDVAPIANKGTELALRVASVVAGKIPGAHAAARTASLDDARAIAARASRLVYVRVQIVKSQLRVTVDAYPVVRNVWDRARLPPPPPSGHAYAAAPIDAEVRAFFPPIPLVLGSVYKASGAAGDVLAAACGDLDGDGAPEILLVGRERVSLARLRANRVQVDRSVAWSALAKRVPVPLREPLGGAAIETGRAFVGTSDRGGVALDADLGAPKPLPGGIPIGAGLCAPVSTSRLPLRAGGPCDVAALPGDGASDAASAYDLVTSAGKGEVAVATSAGGKLSVSLGGVEKATFDQAGAQVVVLDADLDGTPEVAFASDATEGDAITIATVGDGGARVVKRIPAPAGVRALAACPPMGGGAGLVAVVGSEVWLVR